MKQDISRVLKSIAVFLMGFPFFYIFLAAIVFDIPLAKCVSVLLSPMYYLISIPAIVAGFGLWEMQRWCWPIFIISQVFILYGNALLSGSYGESYHKAVAFILSVFLQFLMFLRVSKEIRVPYFLPKIRWWESNPRYRLSAPTEILRKAGDAVQGEILDIGLLGCFVKIRGDLNHGETVSMKMKLYGQELICEGRVVWLAQSTVTHPKGVGIKFARLPLPQRRLMRIIYKRHKKAAVFYRRYRYLVSQEEFGKKLEELEK